MCETILDLKHFILVIYIIQQFHANFVILNSFLCL